jgi:putative endopeptidase
MKSLFLLAWMLAIVFFCKAQMKYIDKANMDLSVKPGDDFYMYANGGWLKANKIPATKTSWGSLAELNEKSLQQMKTLLEEAEGSSTGSRTSQMIGDFYNSGMDTVTLELLGKRPVQRDLEAIDSVHNIGNLITTLTQMRSRGVAGGLFTLQVNQDIRNINVYRLHIGQSGITLPIRDYYLQNDTRSVMMRTALNTYIIKLFVLCGTSPNDAKHIAENIIQTETAIAGAQWTRLDLRDPQKTYNKFAVQDFSAGFSTIKIAALFTALKIPAPDSIIVATPSFFHSLDSLLTAVPLNYWRQIAKFDILKNAAPYLSHEFVDASFEYQKVISGQKEIAPRWQRMATLTDNNLGDLLGKLYVERYFKTTAKQRVLEMVNNLQQTFAERIKRLSWMSDETKQKALIKLNAIYKKIGYPDNWKTYDGIFIKKDSLLANILSCSQWAFNYNLSKLGKPIDRVEFYFTPPTVNAVYSQRQNSITFPAGILQFPLFDKDADDAINYGGIGAWIGHEMTHGFDDVGRKYGADGNLVDWWTKEDANKFNVLADSVIAQYEAVLIMDSLHINGKFTLGENLADIGGIQMAYEAFKKTPEGMSNTTIDGFSPDQRFFLNWAQVWREKILPQTTANLLLTNQHAPMRYRVIIPLQQMQAFYDAFGIDSGDKMWLPVDRRVTIW